LAPGLCPDSLRELTALPQVLQVDFGMDPGREGERMGEKRRERVYPSTRNEKLATMDSIVCSDRCRG